MIATHRRLATLLLLACATTALAQKPAQKPAVNPAPDSLIVSLLTIGPGQGLFDRFGHTAIRVRRPLSGLDSAWNWGMYSFEDPSLVFRFLTGETRYWMAGFPTPLFVNYYRDEAREVWEQELNLTQAQADSMLTFLRWNARPENKFYRYDYYLDNCSTRARDAIDAVLGGALKRDISARLPREGVTFRRETLRLSQAYPTVAFAMSFTLGRRADEQVTPWQEGFVPMRLRNGLRDVTVQSATGATPLVRNERQLVVNERFREQEAVPDYKFNAFGIGLLFAGLVALLAWAATKNGAARIAIGVLGSGWHFIVGFAGTLVLFAGLFTRHFYMGANAAVLFATPVSLALAWFYFRAWSKKASERTRSIALSLSMFTSVAATIGLFVYLVQRIGPADPAPAYLLLLGNAALMFALRRALRVDVD